MKKAWTFDDAPDQTGRTAIVTGANSGLGYEVSLMLARKGAEVVLACRDEKRAAEAYAGIKRRCPDAKLQIELLDLSKLDSVAECAAHVKKRHSRIDLLINNAGLMVPPLSRTEEGFEFQLSVNHLGHYALTGRLLPLIKDTVGARVVSLSSIAASLDYIDFDDLNWEHKHYRRWPAYSQSKLANQMFTRSLASKFASHRSAAIAAAAHPGISSTSLFRNSVFEFTVSKFGQTPEMGALPILRAACGKGVTNGSYWGPSGLFGIKGYPVLASMSRKAENAEMCEWLWEVSERLTGVVYDF